MDRGRYGVRAGRCPRMLAIGSDPNQHGGKTLMKSWDRQKRKLRLEVIRTRTLLVSTVYCVLPVELNSSVVCKLNSRFKS